jgi:TolB protein
MITRNTALILAAGLAAALTTACTSTTPTAARTNLGEQRSGTQIWSREFPVGDPLALSTMGAPGPARLASSRSSGANPSTASFQPEVLARSAFAETRGPGGNLSQVTFSLDGADFDPDVARDGQRIVFASTQHRATADIYIKDVASRVVTQLTNDPAHDVMPKISPDGSRIAFASNRTGTWNIYVMPITGGRAIQVTNSTADDLHPSWSPDGSQLVFCRLGEMSGQWEMWTTEVANNGVARFIGNGLFPQWCPMPGTGAEGADKIAFQRSRERGDRSFSIWTIDVRGGQAFNSTEIASDPSGACINPAWSPDGKWIAYATVPNPGQWAIEGRPPVADLYLVDLTGSNRVSLTSGGGVNLMPTWSSNNRLFFVSNRAGVDNVWAMDTSTVMQLARSNMSGTTFTGNPGAWSTPTVVTAPETPGVGGN